MPLKTYFYNKTASQLSLIVLILSFLFLFFVFLRTGLGRGRAWLHLALMQKKVADYMKALLDHKDLLRSVTLVL